MTNPLYGGSDGLYEELPDNPFPSNTAATAASVQPNIPTPRNAHHTELSKEEIHSKLDGSLPTTLDNRSISSSCRYDETEDCYTVMSPAGTMTVLPRNRHSAASLGGSVPWPVGGAL